MLGQLSCGLAYLHDRYKVWRTNDWVGLKHLRKLKRCQLNLDTAVSTPSGEVLLLFHDGKQEASSQRPTATCLTGVTELGYASINNILNKTSGSGKKSAVEVTLALTHKIVRDESNRERQSSVAKR